MIKKIITCKFVQICLVLIFILELFVFNFRSWESLFFQPINHYTINVGSGLINTGGKQYCIASTEECYIEILRVNANVHNIYLNLNSKEEEMLNLGSLEPAILVNILGTDEGHVDYYYLNTTILYPQNKKSHYIPLDFYGKCNSIILDFSSSQGYTISLEGITLNSRVSFHISLVRILLMILVCFLVFLLKHYLFFEKITIDKTISFSVGKKMFSINITLLIIACILLIQFFLWNQYMKNNAYYTRYNDRTDQYIRMTESLSKGLVYIEEEPDSMLRSLPNPYDSDLRESLGISYLWDYAYYNDTYYVYFGIIPILLFFLPYYIITGNHLLTYQVIYVCLLFACLGLLFFLWKYIRKKCPNIPSILFILLYLVGINVMGGSFLSHTPDFYSIPIILSIALVLWGLSGILISFEKVGFKKYLLISVSSLCMALVAGCRPQFIFASFLLIPIFWNSIFPKTNFEKTGYQILLSVLIPYILVAIGIMYYNFIRFDSVFDFGANYNLTTNDMIHRGIHLNHLFIDLYYYLLQPIQTQLVFPFIEATSISTSYIGSLIVEEMYGGTLITCLLIPLGLYVLIKYKTMMEKKTRIVCLLSFGISLLICVIDGQMAGILYRYSMDYVIFLIIPAFLGLFHFLTNNQLDMNKKIRYQKGILLLSLACLIFYELCLPFAETSLLSPVFYGTVKQIFQFW